MRKGMTLIELLVTTLILSIAITSLMMSFVYAQRINIRNSHRNNATEIISDQFEDIQQMSSQAALLSHITPMMNGIEITKKSSFGAEGKDFLQITADPNPIVTVTGYDLTLVMARVWWGSKPYTDSNSLTMFMISNEPSGG
jgi:prepilin-type N-terminal cleavage/methylation domain-containing protein